jgi:hypothetical protein
MLPIHGHDGSVLVGGGFGFVLTKARRYFWIFFFQDFQRSLFRAGAGNTCFWTQSRVITLGHFSTGIKLDKIPAFSTQSKSFKTVLVVDGQTTVIFFFLLISEGQLLIKER